MARVVVVDDDQDFTDVVEQILNEGGHDVVSCDRTDHVLHCIIAERPNLVLLDIRLGGQPEAGWKILDQLRESALTATIPVIVSSAALDTLSARKQWLEERGIPVLPKPFDIDDLLGLVQLVGEARTTTTMLQA